MHTYTHSNSAAETHPKSARNSIGLRLLRYVFGFYLLITIAVTAVQLTSEFTHTRQDIFKQLKNLEITFAESFAVSIWNFDSDQLDSTLKGMQKIDIVTGVIITDNKNSALASKGIVATDNNTVKHGQQLTDLGITKITINVNGVNENVYQYRFPITYKPDPSATAEQIGNGYIYSHENVIFNRVKYSFIMIIVNSVIKTVALWFIFLVITQRLLATPLQTLTQAILDLNPQNPDSLSNQKTLDNIIKGSHKDELHTLAVSFDQMRHAIVDKIIIIEEQNLALEKRVQERTQDLQNTLLELSKTKDELVSAAHRAGMANTATDVLHNVGNNLNTVKTSGAVLRERLSNPTMKQFIKANSLLIEHKSNLSDFINSPKGEKLMDYIMSLEKSFVDEHEDVSKNLKLINDKVEAISNAISDQQKHLPTGKYSEKLALKKLVDETLLLHKSDFDELKIDVVTLLDEVPQIPFQKIRVLHILDNIITNAKEALLEVSYEQRHLIIKLSCNDDFVFLQIDDTGCGISEDKLEKIFAYGVSSKPDHQGFGLHNAANYMAEMGGSIKAHSSGLNHGTSITLNFPLRNS